MATETSHHLTDGISQPSALFRLVDVVFPGQSNHYGTLFGGAALAMMDKFAFILASRFLRRTVVTAALSETDFRAPVPVGRLAEVDGKIIKAELVAEDMRSGKRTSCLSGRFVMVGQEGVGDAIPHYSLKPTMILVSFASSKSSFQDKPIIAAFFMVASRWTGSARPHLWPPAAGRVNRSS